MSPNPPGTDELRRMLSTVAHLAPAQDDADRIERLRLLEELKSAAAAAQAVEATAFDHSQRAAQAVAGVPSAQQGRGVAAQVALALRVSPWRAQRWLGWSKILTTELPATFTALRSGRTTEWRAMLVARETAVLSREDRAEVDAALAPRLAGWGDRRVEAEARRAAYRLDPIAALERTRNAETDRRVTIRPAPDTMCRLTALLPVAQGVAAYAALGRTADTTTATGDHRGRGQLMADTLVERLTGQAVATDVPVEVNVVIGVDALLGNDDEPAQLQGYGPIPAPLARRLVGRPRPGTPVWLRRLFHEPRSGSLVQLETHRRRFTDSQRRFVELRDQTCRTPWCDAPVRHTDHVIGVEHGGASAIGNAQGLCQACNHAKQAPGWHARPGPDRTITLTTPTGHRYASRAPDPPGSSRARSPVEQRARHLLAA